MNKNNKKNLMRACLIAASLGIGSPTVARASSSSSIDPSYPDWFKTLIEFSEKAEETINENLVDPFISKTDDLREYNNEDLMLVTDMPTTSPEEMRHYYFVSKNTIPIKWTFYYDKNKKRVKQTENPVYKELRTMYPSITDPETVIRITEWTDLRTNELNINYKKWDSSQIVYDEDTPYEYIVFNNFENFLTPGDNNKVSITGKLSISDLKRIEKYINDPEYELDADNYDIDEEEAFKRVRKK